MEISEYIQQIRDSKTGSEMRDPIANAIKAIYEKGSDVDTLAGHTSNYYLTKAMFKNIAYPTDNFPAQNQNGNGSNKIVKSDGVYRIFKGDYSNLNFTLPSI